MLTGEEFPLSAGDSGVLADPESVRQVMASGRKCVSDDQGQDGSQLQDGLQTYGQPFLAGEFGLQGRSIPPRSRGRGGMLFLDTRPSAGPFKARGA